MGRRRPRASGAARRRSGGPGAHPGRRARRGLVRLVPPRWPRPGTSFAPVLAAATALGAARIRIWAGACGSHEASTDDRRATVAGVRAAADQAADRGIGLAFEFHGDTLADTPDATLALLRDVDRSNVGTYWQPPVDAPDDAALAGLDAVLPDLAGVHVFSWWPGTTRQRLEARASLWGAVIERIRARGRPGDALLEFVPDDDPDQVVAAAATLRGWTAST